MPVQDPFSYSARWDSAGIDCSLCHHFKGPNEWPDIKAEAKCKKHDVSLSVELGKAGYKNGEWFCKSFVNDGSAFPQAIKEYESIQEMLDPETLYRAPYGEKTLFEISFSSLRCAAS